MIFAASMATTTVRENWLAMSDLCAFCGSGVFLCAFCGPGVLLCAFCGPGAPPWPHAHDAHKAMTINPGIDAIKYSKPMPVAFAIVVGQLPPYTARNDFSA